MGKTDGDDREQKILDAATKLFLHYGFDKTTVSDIAREAGISKGAIYLHFSSKEALLEALLAREMMAYTAHWLALLDADPHGGTIGGMYKNSLYALSHSAFMAAMFRQDGRILGNYLRKPDNFFMQMRNSREESERAVFVRMMQEAGVMRRDVDPGVVAHVMDMLAFGLVGMDDFIPPEKTPPLTELIEGIATIMDRALTPDDVDNEKGKAIVRQIADDGRLQFEAAQKENDDNR
ncbi:MAG: TetR/AcrR family transcriptional regulator [Anaerolineales bacterium]|nr:TetR/AcrR family transcriptional regulator [Anaerolineales bacterium]